MNESQQKQHNANRLTRASDVRMIRSRNQNKHTDFGEGGKGQDGESWLMWKL